MLAEILKLLFWLIKRIGYQKKLVRKEKDLIKFNKKATKYLNHMLNIMSDTFLGITYLFHGEDNSGDS